MQHLHSHKVQLVLAAVTASLGTVALLSAHSTYRRRARRRELDKEVLNALAAKDLNAHNVPSVAYDEGIVREQLARNYAFFGEESMAKLRKGSVVIVGCGGVGSWAAVMLARSGVSKIRLVDFDYVTLSSLNRHATAGLSDVGTSKVICIEKALRQISKCVEVDSRTEIWRKEDGGALLQGADWVIDAIDNVSTKVDLLKHCHEHGIKVFSSMGAGAKCDPTRIQIADISNTIYDRLARSVRLRLRLLGVSSGIPVVYSTEVPGDVKLLPLPEDEFQKGNVKELGAFDDFRVRILPVIGPLPAIFGLNIATYICCDLAGKPIINPLPVKNRRKLCERLSRDLLVRESKFTEKPLNKLPIDEDDVSLIFEDVSLGRSVIPPHDVPSRPTLVRWDASRPLTVDNCVVMEYKDAVQHENAIRGADGGFKDPKDIWGEEVQAVVACRARQLQQQRDWIFS
ncbi:ubiquitin-protein ligase molybdopterin-converting factor [Amanita muscaria]